MLNVGVIGLGVGRKHAEAYAANPHCRVARLCDLDRDRLDACGAEHPGAALTLRAEDVLRDPDIDVVSLASYDDVHFEQAMDALAHGKHVLVEKPVCLNPGQLREIRAALDAAPGLKMSSNLNLRTCPLFLRLKKAVDQGDMGPIFHMEADYLWGRIAKLTHGWRSGMDFYSVIHGAAVHMIDLVMWLSGRRPVSVQAMGNRIATRGSKMRYNDFAVLILGFADGMTAKITANGGCVHPHFHRVAVFGGDKTFVHEPSGAKLYSSRDPKARPEAVMDEYPGRAQKADLVHSFVLSILEPSLHPVVDEEDVFATMSVCFAAEEAVRTGGTIEIEYL